MKKRSIVTFIILSIITCGIYTVWWTYTVSNDLQRESGVSKIPPVATTLLMLFISAAGGALLGYDCNVTINEIKAKRGLPQQDNMILWLVLGIIFPIVTAALVQNEINKLLDNKN